MDARHLHGHELEGADDAAGAFGDEISDLRLREVLEDLCPELV